MKTKLDKLIEIIDPSQTLDLEAARVNEALNLFLPKLNNRNIIQNRDDFKTLMADFYCHVGNVIFHTRPPRKPQPDFDWYRSKNMLEKEYGSNGEDIAFDMARTNIGGGLYAVLKVVAGGMVDEYASNYIGSRVSDFLKSLSVDEKLAAIQEYLDKYSQLIPSELMEGGAVNVRLFFWKVLEEHPKIVQKLRNVNRGG